MQRSPEGTLVSAAVVIHGPHIDSNKKQVNLETRENRHCFEYIGFRFAVGNDVNAYQERMTALVSVGLNLVGG